MEKNIFPLSVVIGTDFRITFYYFENDDVTPIDLTGYTAYGAIYDSPGGSVILDLHCTIPPPETGGTLEVTLSSIETDDLLPTAPGCGGVHDYFYSIDLMSGSGIITRFMEGSVYVRN